MLASMSLEGKTIIITGGGTGLGREMVRCCARAGADFVIAARRPGPIQETAREVRDLGRRALAIPTDVTDSAQVNRMVEQTLAEFGKVDVLINNAAVLGQPPQAIWDITDEQWRRGIEGNLSGAFYCTRAVAKSMVEKGKGRIINVASGFGLRGNRDGYMYACGKGGVVQLSRALTMSLSRYGITAVTIVPGFFPTNVSEDARQAMSRNEFIPVGHAGDPREIGPLAAFLASDAAAYFNGECFLIDGGGLAGGFAPTGYVPEVPLPR